MEWRDTGVVLGARRHGESGALVEVLTENHGRHLGFVHGRRRLRGLVEKGNILSLRWRARLHEHMGVYTPEVESVSGVLDDARALFALNSVCALGLSLPERVPCPLFFERFCGFLERLKDSNWLKDYVFVELDLLRELGYGLDLSRCVVTQRADALCYVSPKSGKAVSKEAGDPWKKRLFSLPRFMVSEEEASCDEVLAALKITGHFLRRCVYSKGLPAAREYFCQMIGEEF